MRKLLNISVLLVMAQNAIAQNVGIGTNTPKVEFNIAANKAVLFGADTSGGGSKVLWYPFKSAFRAGFLQGNDHFWDYGNLGIYSFATGERTQASNTGTTAMGSITVASGLYSTAFGYASKASGDYTTAMGYASESSGHYSTALGFNTTASGRNSTAMGVNSRSRSFSETAIGCYNTDYTPASSSSWAPTDRIFSIGNGTDYYLQSDAMVILKNGNTGFGSSNPTKKFEVVGLGVTGPVSLVIGNQVGFGPAALEFVSDYGTANQWRPGYIQSNDLGIFTGSLEFYTNGTGTSSLYNSVKGFEVRNGAALTATGSVGSYSDARLKNNITPFTDGLNVISKISPVQFYYNADAPFKTNVQQTGIIAQELEQVAPYMVEKNREGGYEDLRSVNNQAYTFLLINAVKEQQEKIEKLQSENANMKKDIDTLKRQMEKILTSK
jgi:hypothetical protein